MCSQRYLPATRFLALGTMTQTIELGRGTDVAQLAVADGIVVAQIPGDATAFSQKNHQQCFESIADRVAAALTHPEQFLGIAEMVVPGDTVAIALEDGLPHLEAIVAGILRSLAGANIAKVEVVVPPSIGERAINRLRASLPESVELAVHNVADRAALRYLGADDDAEPIRVNRSLVDADFVLPVSVMRVTDPLLGGSSGDALYPGLVDDAQQKRLQRSTARAISRRENYHDQWAAGQAHQVRWNLGVQLMLAVEVTVGGDVGYVVASSPETLRETVRAHYAQRLGGVVSDPAEVVVACVEGDDSQQSLENLMRAALVARSHTAPSGSIVLMTTLKDLGSGIGLSDRDEEDGDFADHHLEADADAESDDQPLAQSTLSQAVFARDMLKDLINDIDTSRRYLLYFDGDWEAAEAFGFGVIQNEAALARLINQHSSCCVVRTAQTAVDAGVLRPSVS
jgi:hypothetical protein